MDSRTKQALALIDQGIAAYSAAQQVGITPQAVYRAQKRERDRATKAGQLATCPCCGSLVKPEQIKTIAE